MMTCTRLRTDLKQEKYVDKNYCLDDENVRDVGK